MPIRSKGYNLLRIKKKIMEIPDEEILHWVGTDISLQRLLSETLHDPLLSKNTE